MRTYLLIACLAVLSPLPAIAAQSVSASSRTPAAEIDALIDRVAKAKGVIFIRNGTEHTAAQAAEHLQRKRKAAGKRIATPEQFIEQLGTRSSVTGKAYRVRLPNGTEIDSAVWLNGLLREVRAGR
ncbi:DUF5329 family protein [Noviluteimonas gilva]|uniref:DUF5329 domain-containing protein n=1 Tax=Noviluteimonas gilva TaxID=2682097 RepID=A0A7C9HLE1_9GAMM|nr:DUF5329 family protein [Lysobacter gilvus]MUV13652.1 hypothetical protein [Lysobacter gilvus]